MLCDAKKRQQARQEREGLARRSAAVGMEGNSPAVASTAQPGITLSPVWLNGQPLPAGAMGSWGMPGLGDITAQLLAKVPSLEDALAKKEGQKPRLETQLPS